MWSAVIFFLLTRVMTPSSWAVERDAIFGVERPLTGGEELARERAVTEVGIVERGRSVTFSPSMLPLFTRLSISSARSSADSRSTWIILQQMAIACISQFKYFTNITPNFLHWFLYTTVLVQYSKFCVLCWSLKRLMCLNNFYLLNVNRKLSVYQFL